MKYNKKEAGSTKYKSIGSMLDYFIATIHDNFSLKTFSRTNANPCGSLYGSHEPGLAWAESVGR